MTYQKHKKQFARILCSLAVYVDLVVCSFIRYFWYCCRFMHAKLYVIGCSSDACYAEQKELQR